MKNITHIRSNQSVKEKLLPFATGENYCNFCKSINHFPYFHGPHISETVKHVLTECPLYHQLRSQLSVQLKSLVIRTDYNNILNNTSPDIVSEFQMYIINCTALRNSGIYSKPKYQ